jgi:hypothetical protein
MRSFFWAAFLAACAPSPKPASPVPAPAPAPIANTKPAPEMRIAVKLNRVRLTSESFVASLSARAPPDDDGHELAFDDL